MNKKAKKKDPVGRPSKYDPKFCEMLIDHMRGGLSFESFSAVIGVNRDTLYAWCEQFGEFSDAKKIAFEKNLLFWEKTGIDGLWGNKDNAFNSTVWIFNMKNRHKWRDRQDIEAQINSEDITREKLRKMPLSELMALIKENMSEENL